MATGARLSGLTTRGRCLLAAGAATAGSAIVLDERDLLRVGLFVALLPLLALLLSARAQRVVRVSRTLTPQRVTAGAAVEVALHVTTAGGRGGSLLGALRLVDTVPDAAGQSSAAPPRFALRGLSARSGAVLTYPLRPVQRGVHRIGPLACRATDPLGLAEFERDLVAPSRLVALPRVVPLHGRPQAIGPGEGGTGAALAHHGQGRSDVLVRAYRQGDELRRVHWRSTARHDELMVRLEERPRSSGASVLLDRRDAAHRGRGPDTSLELAVSLAASICAHLGRSGDVVTLLTEDGAELGSTTGDVEPLLDALAALRPAARTDLAGPDLPGDVVAVLGALDATALDALLTRAPGAGHAVLLDVAGWAPRGGAAPSTAAAADALRRAGWNVAVARAGSTPDRAWADLVDLGGRP